MLSVEWQRSCHESCCPLCGYTGSVTQILRYEAEQLAALADSSSVSVLQCPTCELRYCEPMISVDYTDADEDGLKFYLETGAGIDVMLEALGLTDSRPIRDYLEIGCSFGFVMDY